MMEKKFEVLYHISMMMADTCLTVQDIEARFDKLHEEYQELVKEWADFQALPKGLETVSGHNKRQEIKGNLVKEAADVLFVLLHIGHKFGYTAKDLLHMGATKMLSRLNDPNYIAKEQRNG